MNLFRFSLYENANKERRERLDALLEPPDQINPATGVPYSWGDPADELDGWESVPRAGG